MSETSGEVPNEPITEQSQAWRGYYDAWILDDEYRENDREEFDEMAGEVQASVLDPLVGEQLSVGADFFRWLLYARRGDPLPSSLSLVRPHEHSLPRVVVHPNHPAAAYSGLGVVWAFATSAKFKGFVDLLIARDADDWEAHHLAAQQVIQSLPVYKLVRSFGEHAETPHDRLLSPFEKQVRAAGITEEVRHHFTIPPEEHIESASFAGRTLLRRLSRLDDETVRNIEKGGQARTPIERARDFFIDLGLKRLRAEETSESRTYITRVTLDEQGLPRVHFTSRVSGEEGSGVPMFAGGTHAYGAIVEELDRLLPPMELDVDNMVDGFLQRFLPNLGGLHDWEEAIDAAVKNAAEDLMEVTSFSTFAYFLNSGVGGDSYRGESWLSQPFWAAILAPEGVGFNARNYPEAFTIGTTQLMSEYSTHASATVHSREREEELRTITLATAQRYHAAARDFTSRLVMMSRASLPRDLPRSVPAADLVLEFSEGSLVGLVTVPGYRLLASHNNRYQYSKLEDDPYERCDVSLPDTAELLSYYEGERYDVLATVVRTGKLQSVADLVRAIKKSSDYTYDVSAEEVPYTRIQVRQGRPQVQCTGAAHILKESLEILFGMGEVQIVAGTNLHYEVDQLTGVGHAQVAATLEGKTFLLDATPGGGGDGPDRDTRHRLRDLFRRAGPQLLPYVVPPDREELIPDFDSSESTMSQLPPTTPRELRNGLELYLRAALDHKTDVVLLEGISKLPEADPVRRTLSLAVQSTGRHGITSDVEQLREYLQGYPSLSPAQLKQYGLRAYSRDIMKVLAEYVDNLQQL
ncbi:MAG TPA: hypothetical protein VGE30_03415 [Candidatus Saccharimonadales bacterium]